MATLTLTFTGTTPAPIGGYVVKYWPVGRPDDGDGKTVTASPAVFNNVPAGVYQGTIEAACGGGVLSTPVAFNVSLVETVPYSITGGTPSASCGNPASGVLVVNTAGYKARVTTVYYSGTGSRPGATLTIKQGQNVIATVSSPVTTNNTPLTVASANIPIGNYTWILTEVNCSNGSGVSSFSMSNT
jgi:hypothetical protein